MAGRGPGGEGTSQQAKKSVPQRGAGPPGGDMVRTLAPGGTGLLEGSRRMYFRSCFSCRGCFSSRGSMAEGSWTQLDLSWIYCDFQGVGSFTLPGGHRSRD